MSGASSAGPVAETEVTARAARRHFSVAFKTRIVQEAERLRGTGEVGALLRREGLYSSQLTTWRQQYRAGVRQALSQKRGPKPKADGVTPEVARLERANAHLREQLARAELVITIQKKVSALLDVPLTEPPGAPT